MTISKLQQLLAEIPCELECVLYTPAGLVSVREVLCVPMTYLGDGKYTLDPKVEGEKEVVLLIQHHDWNLFAP